MEYHRLKDGFLVRLDKDEEIIESIRKISVLENIKTASVQGIGALSFVEIGRYLLNERKFVKKELKGDFEVVSLSGNITLLHENKVNIHLHIALADENFNLFGGHLVVGIVSATMEIFIHPQDKIIKRKYNNQNGLNIIE